MDENNSMLFNYDHKETHKNKENIYEYSFNHKIKGLKEDFDLCEHLATKEFFRGFANEEIFMIGIAIGRGLLTLEDYKE